MNNNSSSSSFNVVDPNFKTEGDAPVFGRIGTFTWPSMNAATLSDIARNLGLGTTVPSTGLNVAVYRAVEREASIFRSSRYKRFARRIKDNVTELVQEVVIGSDDGEVKGQRETVARFVVTGGYYVIKPENDLGRTWLEEEGGGEHFDKRVEYERATVPAGLVGQWADQVVLDDIGGIELANRGHSFHVPAANANRFDAFMTAMVEASNKCEQVFVAKTVDNSPETLGSLVRSMRATIEKAIEASEEAAAKAATKRGVDGAIRRLQEQKVKLGKYAELFGDEGLKMNALIDKAVDGITCAEVVKEYGGMRS